MSFVEIVAATFGALAVFLSTREHVASWPIGIVNVALYAYVFFDAQLYASAGLQGVYLLLSAYGWYQWLRGSPTGTPLALSRLSRPLIIGSMLAALGGAAALGGVLANETNAKVPFLDALLTTTSLVAQWMLARKIVENWAVWIVVDLIYVPMYLLQGLPVTAALYVVFLLLAVNGLREWTARWKAQTIGGTS